MRKVAPIFQDENHQNLFDKQGFIVLPFLNNEELNHMNLYFDSLHPFVPESGFHSGSYSSSFEYKEKVSNEIKHIFSRRYNELFQNFTAFGGAFLFKIPSNDSELFIHQDWTIVDEDKFVALNIWVPLCDITLENGPLMIVPGSHYNNFPVIRAPTMGYFFDVNIEKTIEFAIPQIVKAGTAVILNQSVIHYSPANQSNKIRKAITAGVKTAGAPMVFHYQNPDGQIEKFKMEDNFLLRFDNFFKEIFERPTQGESMGNVDNITLKFTSSELIELLKEMRSNAGFEYQEDSKDATDYVSSSKTSKNFWRVYTPKNILNEIFGRLKMK